MSVTEAHREAVYRALRAEPSRGSAYVINETIDTLLSAGPPGLRLVNEVLMEADVSEMPALSRVGLVRCSFPARELLPEWAGCLGRVRDSLRADGEDDGALLRGLGGER